jgi:multidrug efflux pump subunit AcrA (membrane-fusion protein)
MKPDKKIVIPILILLTILLAYLLFLKRPSAVKVTVSEVVQGDLTSVVSAPGIVRPLTEVQISSSISGIVQQLAVKEGQEVGKGDLLMQIEPSEFRAQVRRAQAGLEVAGQTLSRPVSVGTGKTTIQVKIDFRTGIRNSKNRISFEPGQVKRVQG